MVLSNPGHQLHPVKQFTDIPLKCGKSTRSVLPYCDIVGTWICPSVVDWMKADLNVSLHFYAIKMC